MSALSYHTPTTKSNTPIALREQKARALLATGAIRPIASDGHTFAAWVRSQSRPDTQYLVTLGIESCSCYDYEHGSNARLCKHILACRFFYVQQFEREAAR